MFTPEEAKQLKNIYGTQMPSYRTREVWRTETIRSYLDEVDDHLIQNQTFDSSPGRDPINIPVELANVIAKRYSALGWKVSIETILFNQI